MLIAASSVVNAQLSPISIGFNVIPKIVSSTPADFNFGLSFTLNSGAIPSCPGYNPRSSDGFYWSVEERYQSLQGDYYRLIRTGFSKWPGASSPVALDFTENIAPVGNPRYITFWASADCSTYIGGGLIQSSPVTVQISSGQGGFIETANSGKGQPIDFKIQNPIVGNPTNVLGVGIIIANWIFNIAIPVTVVFIIYAGFKFIISRGNPGKVQEARRLLWYTVIGLTIVLIGKGFIVLIQSILG